MARLQVLYLPTEQITPGGDGTAAGYKARYALVLDGLDTLLTREERDNLDSFAAAIGAAGVYATTRTVDCEQGGDVQDKNDEDAVKELHGMLNELAGEAVRAAMARQGSPAGKGSVLRTWESSEKDPRESIPGWKPKEAADV